MNHIEQLSSNVLEAVREPSPEALAICEKGDYPAIRKELEDKGLFAAEVERVKAKCLTADEKHNLKEAEFLTEKDWQILTVIELYDAVTFDHSLETYHIAKEKIEKELDNGVVISNLIKEEGVSLETFYRSCLMHDVGKISIPKFILNNKADVEISHRSRLKDLLTADQIAKLLEIDPAGKFSLEKTIAEAMQVHESESKRYLEGEGYNREAFLASTHHNYGRVRIEEMRFPVSHTTLHISDKISTLLRLADMESAMRQKARPYKDDMGKVKTLYHLVEDLKADMDRGLIDPMVTELWISDEYKIRHSERVKHGHGASVEEQAEFDMMIGKIEQFIKEQKGKNEK